MTLDGAVLEEARRLGINVSQAAEGGVIELNPRVTLSEEAYLVMPQLAATLTLAEMGEKVG